MTEPQQAVAGQVMTSAQAAKALLLTRARLAELVWTGQLRQAVDGGFSAADVAALARRRATPKSGVGESPPQMRWTRHRATWLLHDWGGTGRAVELARALHLEITSLSATLRAMARDGYLSRHSDGWHLTDKGWEYCSLTEPPH